MSLKWNIVVGSNMRASQVNIIFKLNSTSFHRPWRRKMSRYLVIRSNHQLSSSSYSSSQDNLFHACLSQLNSLDLLAPALGFTTALAILYNSTTHNHLSNRIGEWNLFTSPTPFNRFVKLRCESLLLEDSNEKLVDEDGHLVSFDSGPIQQTDVNDYTNDVFGEQISYQRICISTDDGGVVSLDWPSNLELSNEHGLDTTVLVVPGTTDGSMDEDIRSFVYECLKRGCFPIVMNPRGCARSPLTTPRLFTAADSDDVCTSVQFVQRARPWATLMGVGLGYGANMLTKYLAEVGEETPLTAATCLDNPFDLKWAARSPSHHYVNQNLTGGLIDMLKSNKELFQGRGKGFDVEKALRAKSLKEFDEALSMVSYGFDSIKEFYANSSTKDVVGNVKIPLLFIQNDAVPYFSIPRGLIAENPYTSLLTCTFQSNDKNNTGISSVLWCQHLVVEWLTAVELGLLKGRHPLLEDTDVTINPSKRLKLMANKATNGSIKNNTRPQLDDLDVNGSHPSKKKLKASSGLEIQKFEAKDKELKPITNGSVTQTSLVETEVANEGGDELAESERGKMLQAAEVVMNMLDVTMPDTLSEEQKKKVLTAVGKGETLMSALQGAVPEEVRGKLTSAVTAIMESRKKIADGLSNVGRIPDAISAVNGKMGEKSGVSSPEKEPKTSDHKGDTDTSKNDASSKVAESESHKSHDESGNDNQSADVSKEKIDVSSKVEPSNSSEEHQVKEPVKDGHEGEKKEKDSQQKEEKPNDEKNISPPKTEEVQPPPASSENQVDGENQKKEESSVQPVPSDGGSNPPPPPPPPLGVTPALDALTGMDDSTQLAVNSVFSVIEDVITQLEGSKDDGDDDSATGDNDNNKVVDKDTSTVIDNNHDDVEQSITNESKDEAKNHDDLEQSIINESKDEGNSHDDVEPSISKTPYKKSLYYQNAQSHLLSNMKNSMLPDSDAESDVHLDYVPEEGQWKLLGQSEDGRNHDDDNNDDDDAIEPCYVILDEEGESDKEIGDDDDASVALKQNVKKNLIHSLRVEVCRRINATDMEDIAPTLQKELERVADAISLAVISEKHHLISSDGDDMFGPRHLHAEHIMDAITSAVQGTKYLKKVIPLGIVVGSSLASLRKVFNIAPADFVGSTVPDQISDDELPLDKVDQIEKVHSEYQEKVLSSTLTSDGVMAGAVTAALGASAFLVHQQGSGDETSSMPFNQNENNNNHQEADKSSKSSDDNIVTSLAEKAMLVAGPVMPTKKGGEVDQDRLVAMLADLGQRGGMLRLVGKAALLWGGLRGAMSLIGKLISFLRLSERPLYQRVLGFAFLVLVLWTPVVVPLLPTLVQNWASHNSSGFAELACILGLYSSVTVLILLWGKRIRDYDNPLEKYGLEFTSPKQIKNILSGLVGGVMLVSLIQITNMSLGLVSISWSTTTTPSFTDPVTLLKFSGQLLRICGQGLVTATAISLVEELLFRSWLYEEITVDLGYNLGIILSGLAFSISQWSLRAIPGLWLLSLGLAGIRQRFKGSLSFPIGLRAGIMASSFVLKEGGFLVFQPSYPWWVISGGDPFQPFNNIVGLAFAVSWAAALYPRNPPKKNIIEETENEETEKTPPQ
ncbi:hypothetical protein LXL04_002280 [Taraxacum kok-saghyz]